MRFAATATGALVLAISCFAADETKPTRCDFSSRPDGASVVVDGRLRGTTPLTLYDIAPGFHTVHYELDNYDGDDDSFTVTGEGGYVQKHAALEPVKGLLLVTSEPEECEISLDGLSLGMTPRLITSLDAKDAYRLLVQKPGYQQRFIEVKFNGRTPLVKHVDLIVDAGMLDITSDPSGAQVTINGIQRGKTPLKVKDVPKGRATVTLSKPGFDDETRELSMTAGESQTLFIRMNGQPGSLRLSSVPDGARFYVNGDPAGKSPVRLDRLKPGKYKVRAELEGYGNLTKNITVDNGSDVSEEFRLESVMGRIEIRTSPPGVQVFFDGRNLGATKGKPGAENSDVFAIENVVEGEHTVELKCRGYADVVKHPDVESKSTETVNVKMKRIFSPDVEITTDHGKYRGMLKSNTDAGVVIEVQMGIERTFPRSEIRGLDFLQ
ncbi:MAG: PEGA domain-containing protein [Kiritimatiellae bacterium]|nr:PEGA domain-containing protein [Kiritimatiellia bacterium]